MLSSSLSYSEMAGLKLYGKYNLKIYCNLRYLIIISQVVESWELPTHYLKIGFGFQSVKSIDHEAVHNSM